MDCKSARLLMEFARPGSAELDAGEADALQQHLADCLDCNALAAAERRADEHIGRAMRDVPLPEGLQERLLKRLTAERDAWYLRWAKRAAAAAVLFFAVGLLGYFLWFHDRPVVSSDVVRRMLDHEGLATKEEVTEAFKKTLGVTVVLPGDLNYAAT